jgi:soluble lytic murein transglycosylase-like protein
MYPCRRTRRASLLAFALCATAATAALAEDNDTARAYVASGGGAALATPTALSSEDRLSYTTAFDALRRGDLELARTAARQAKDRVLLGQVEFERLFHPSHTADFDELATWLESYADLPMAPRVYALAMRRLPDGAAEPKRPGGLLARTWDTLTSAPSDGGVNDPAKAARVALNNDDLAGAYAQGVEIGDWWTAGLAAWRLGEHSDAFRAFDHVAQDPTEDPWVRSGGAFWAARAAGQSGRHERVVDYLRQAARWPATFYGQIALRQLGEEPVIENLGPRPYEAATLKRAVFTPEPIGVDARELNAFIQSDETARRTVALYEVGRSGDAEQAARNGLRAAGGDKTARQMWAGLYRLVAGGRAAQADAVRIDALRYPMPELQPEGGFTIEKALVYAIARKETDFNAAARSSAGAYGLMQVMPTTAAHMTGDQGFVRNPQRLLDPAVNMKLGQEYVNRLFQIESFQGDLLKAVASYNAGPGPMLAAIRKLGADADPLLLIESIDVPQARDYVEKVVAAYWIYQRMMGGPLKTLDAVASGARAVPIRLDYVAPAPAPLQVAEAVLAGAR